MEEILLNLSEFSHKLNPSGGEIVGKKIKRGISGCI
jgi:hypothetical protein